MKYLATFFIVVFLSVPTDVFGASAFGHSSGSNVSNTTSISFSHTATGDSLLVAMIQARATTGGCGATELTGFSATYNGTALSFSKGTADTSVTHVPASDCVHAKLMYLANPSTGANTFAASWTGNGYVAITVMSFSGAGSLGTIGEQKFTGTAHSASCTITSSDIAMGGIAFADLTTAVSSAESNYIETADAGGYSFSGSATQAYTTGTETVSFTTSNYGAVTWCIPVLATAVVTETPSSVTVIFD